MSKPSRTPSRPTVGTPVLRPRYVRDAVEAKVWEWLSLRLRHCWKHTDRPDVERVLSEAELGLQEGLSEALIWPDEEEL